MYDFNLNKGNFLDYFSGVCYNYDNLFIILLNLMKNISFLKIIFFLSFLISGFNAWCWNKLLLGIGQKVYYKMPLLETPALQLNYSFFSNVITGNLFLDYGRYYLANKITSDNDFIKSSKAVLLFRNGVSGMKEKRNKKKYLSFSISFLKYFFSTYVLLLKSQSIRNKINSQKMFSSFNEKMHAIYPVFNIAYPFVETIEEYYHNKKNEKSITDFFIKHLGEIFSEDIVADLPPDSEERKTFIDKHITQDLMLNILAKAPLFRFDNIKKN